jgi:hypothetical protein
MGGWIPGKPVLTEADREQWQAWRAERKRQQQRERRQRLRRFDYHASQDTAAVLEALWKPKAGNDFSSIIDRIVRAWVTLPPE